jgi:DNA-binding MarR family transcriptional regulator
MGIGVDPRGQKSGHIDVSKRTYTEKQGNYLAFIYAYTEINGVAPAETDMQRYFRVSPPTVHQMVKKLQANGLIDRTPGAARTIKVLLDPSELPILRRPRRA